jgi:hypothetical protein
LKEVYLASMKRLRVDVLIYILWELILPDIMQDHLRSAVELRARVLSKAERARKKIADSFTGKFYLLFIQFKLNDLNSGGSKCSYIGTGREYH